MRRLLPTAADNTDSWWSPRVPAPLGCPEGRDSSEGDVSSTRDQKSPEACNVSSSAGHALHFSALGGGAPSPCSPPCSPAETPEAPRYH